MEGDDTGLEDSTLSYIFLDVISCGLGGAILLGVILAVPHEQRAVAVSTAPYLVVRAEVWEADGTKPDTQALPNVRVKPPHGTAFDLPLESFDLATGRVRRGADVFRNATAGELAGTQVFLTGFFRHAEGEARLADLQNGLNVPLYELRITEPPAGDWTFQVRYQNRRDLADRVGGKIPAVRVRLSAYAAGAAAAVEAPESTIAFGELSKAVTVKVNAGRVKNVVRK